MKLREEHQCLDASDSRFPHDAMVVDQLASAVGERHTDVETSPTPVCASLSSGEELEEIRQVDYCGIIDSLDHPL